VADIALAWDLAAGAADMVVDGPDLRRDDGLETAVLISLFTDRRAHDTDVIPDGTDNRRGWWADAFAETPGDRIGSRLWLLDRAKPTATTRQRLEDYAREALAWLTEDQVAEDVAVTAEFLPASQALARLKSFGGRALDARTTGVLDGYLLTATIRRPLAVTPTNYRYHLNWKAQLGG
jgi:phage gp46-like protein